MTVLDTSAAFDFLLGVGVADQVEALVNEEGELAAPDLLVFETVAVLRREAFRGSVSERRAGEAVEDLADLPVEMFPSMALRTRAWALRANLTAADALFLSLAEQLDEPLATKDRALARAAPKHSTAAVIHLVTP